MAAKQEIKAYSYREAGKILGIHWTTLDKAARRGDLKTIPGKGIPESELLRFRDLSTKRRMDRQQRHKDILAAHKEGGKTLKQIGEMFGVSESWVSLVVSGKGKDRHKKAK